MNREAIDYTTPADVMITKESPELAKQIVATEFSWAEVLRLGDWAIKNPTKWPTIKARLQHPQASIRELAAIQGITTRTALRHLKAIKELRVSQKKRLMKISEKSCRNG